MYASLCLYVQVGNYIHYMSMFVTGFAVGFSAEWKLVLVTLAVVPAIAITGSFHAALFTGRSKSQQEYWEAVSIAEQVCVFFLLLSRVLVAPVFPSDPRTLHPEILTKLPLL
jgi:ATP-binding cassette subfamily B (MDR/TAP) protein 1